MSHTKGTLIVRRAVDSRYRYVILDEKGQLGEAYPGFVSSTGETTWDAEANARLWAAAGDLLEACKAILARGAMHWNSLPLLDSEERLLIAAIAKATVTEAEVGQ